MPQPTVSLSALDVGDADLLYQALTDTLTRHAMHNGDVPHLREQIETMHAARGNLMLHRPLSEEQRAVLRSALATYVGITPIEADASRIVSLLESIWVA